MLFPVSHSRRRCLQAIATLCLAGCLPAQTPLRGPERAGHITPHNRLEARFTPLLDIDFEDQSIDWGAPLTASSALAIEGSRSLHLVAPARYAIPPAWLPLQPGRTYVIEYSYRLPGGLRPGSKPGEFGGLVLEREGLPDTPLGRSPGDLFEASGSIHTSVRLHTTDVRFVFEARRDSIVFDRIRIFRMDLDALRARIPFWKTGFPRLGNYSLTTPDEVSLRSRMPASEVRRLLSMYDFLTGTDIDHTTGAAGWVRHVRSLNPAIRLLPYHNSFAASFSGLPAAIPGTGLQNLFVKALADEWFATGPGGNKLNEPDYPFIFQMNHSRFCQEVDGETYTTFSLRFLADTVLGSGLWDGIHFDQPEWYPNPLLNPRSLPTDAPFPAIDLNRDGRAETTAELYQEWHEAYQDFFAAAARRLGPARLMLGNAGYIPSNQLVLPALNGFMREVFSPYQIQPNGEWNTDNAAGWHRIYQNYTIADTVTRAPQMVTLEFSGEGLGTPTGSLTANGLPDRSLDLTPRDYRRVRLGLTTALLGNGFFEYDLVDNTTAPLWFDEFAVDAAGYAVHSPQGKGYLGQPLGVPRELESPSRILFWADFDNSQLPSWVSLASGTRLSNQAAEVIEGNRSLVASRSGGVGPAIILSSNPQTLELFPGRTYQLLADYRVLAYQGERFQGLLAVSFQPPVGTATLEQAGSLFQPDVFGVGQSGTLRTVVKIPTRGYRALVSILDNATVSFDNVRLVESTGGVYRRDFENGIVLVNPTPEPISVSLAQIAGPLNRTGIRRIRGVQAPAWNNGQPVTAALLIPPGDGIVLLANRIAPPAMDAPGTPKLEDAPGGVRLAWRGVPQYVAGYLIRYGHDPAALTREAATGRVASLPLSQLELQPGLTYFARVAAVDFAGNPGPFSEVLTSFAPGTRQPGPIPDYLLTAGTPVLAPGAFAVLEGSALSTLTQEAEPGTAPLTLGDTEVTVNGISASLLFVSPRRVEFLVPWETAGEDAVVRLARAGHWGQDLLARVEAAHPVIRTGAEMETAAGPDGARLPAVRPGEELTVYAHGLGRVAGGLLDGAAPRSEWEARVVANVEAALDGEPAEVLSAAASLEHPGMYAVRLRVPAGTASGARFLRLSAGGRASNPAAITVQPGDGE